MKNHYNSSSFLINPQDSVRIDEKGELPNPFHGESIGNVIGDTVSISFGENKCTVYFKDFSSGTFGGNGVFSLEEYDNYTKELVNQRSYTLRYSIDSADYKKATTCK
ncbi:hypothetical protein [Flexibacter flexilis]|uniref:hypothetical protein n=1 Tax=Flexibacter flexilis TaxID=998 RepID=UPI00116043ED|nr:hypothetical protein [Flexibacter flexilis]